MDSLRTFSASVPRLKWEAASLFPPTTLWFWVETFCMESELPKRTALAKTVSACERRVSSRIHTYDGRAAGAKRRLDSAVSTRLLRTKPALCSCDVCHTEQGWDGERGLHTTSPFKDSQTVYHCRRLEMHLHACLLLEYGVLIATETSVNGKHMCFISVQTMNIFIRAV